MAHHVIGYAYPTSETAQALGRGKTGCYYFAAAGALAPHDSYLSALAAAQAAGTTPDRWSMDHPANDRFLPREPAR